METVMNITSSTTYATQADSTDSCSEIGIDCTGVDASLPDLKAGIQAQAAETHQTADAEVRATLLGTSAGAKPDRTKWNKNLWTKLTSAGIVILLIANLAFQVYHHQRNAGGSNHDAVRFEAAASQAANGNATDRINQTKAPLSTLFLEYSEHIGWIHVAIDILAVPSCVKRHGRQPPQPCRNQARYITPDSQILKPLRCVDDAFQENRAAGAVDSCTAVSSTFQLLANPGRVRVHRSSVYLFIARFTLRLPELAEVHLGVAINDEHLSLLCTVQSYGTSGPNQPAPYSYCTVQGLRRLKPGDEVWLFVSQGGIPLQSLYRSTFMQIARIGS